MFTSNSERPWCYSYHLSYVLQSPPQVSPVRQPLTNNKGRAICLSYDKETRTSLIARLPSVAFGPIAVTPCLAAPRVRVNCRARAALCVCVTETTWETRGEEEEEGKGSPHVQGRNSTKIAKSWLPLGNLAYSLSRSY